MPRHSDYVPILPGETIGDFTILRAYRDEKNDRRMLSMRCNICNRIKEKGESELKRHGLHDYAKHDRLCGYGTRYMDKKFHDIWGQMKQRIHNENAVAYNNYGGRGLTCDYDNFEDFKRDMYVSYLETKAMYPGERISIDRINNNLGYVKGNLGWTTPIHQTRNSRMVRKFIGVDPNGQVYLTNNQLQFGINHGLESRHISDCLKGKQKTTAGWRFYEPDPLFEYQYESDPTIIKELYY